MGATETVKWVLQVVDVISAPVRTSVLALAGLDSQLRTSDTNLTRFQKTLHGVTLGLKLLGGAGGVIGTALSAATGGLLAAAGVVKDALASVGETAFGNVAFREDTIVGLKAIFRSMISDEKQAGEAANQLFDHAMQAALQTKFETKDIVSIYSKLMTSGFKVGELDTLTAAIANVSTAFGLQSGQRFMNALRTMQSTGRVQWGTFRQAGLASGNIPIREIAGMLGLDLKKSTPELTKAVQKEMLKGVDASIGIKALLTRIKGFFDPGGKLGDYAVKQSETLSGIYSNFKEAVTNIFMTREFGALPALETLKVSLKSITKMFSASSDEGKRFMALVNSIATDVLSIFDIDEKSASGLVTTITEIGEFLEKKVIKPFTQWLKETAGPGLVKMLGSEGGLLAALRGGVVEMGRLLGVGVYQGFKLALSGGANELLGGKEMKDPVKKWNSFLIPWGDIFSGRGPIKIGPKPQLLTPEDGGMYGPAGQAGQNTGKALDAGLRQSLGIHSPSRKGIEIGTNLGESIHNSTRRALSLKGGPAGGGGVMFTGPVYLDLQPQDDTDSEMERAMGEALLRLVRRSSRAPGADVLEQELGAT